MRTATIFHRFLAFAAILAALGLAGCGDDTETVTQPDLVPKPRNYNGPAEANDDVRAFRNALWIRLATVDRCGSCHGTGGQAPPFVRTDDINLAYAAANTVVDLANPEQSRLVERVAAGHNCWTDDTRTCAEEMTGYIREWANATIGGPAATVQLVAPPSHVPGQTRAFPADSTLFSTTVYPVVDEYCSRCHAPEARNPQAPFFAAANVDTAWAAARNTINLDDPARSRLVQRLGNEFHNCWGDCTANAAEMRDAIAQLAAGIPVVALPAGTIASRALGLREGIPATGGGRFDANLIARYEFKEGTGDSVRDSSGISPALDLRLTGSYEWVGGWGVRFTGGKAQGSTLASRKLRDTLAGTNEYSIEAWVAPANVAQEGPARIVSYSGSATSRNFLLGQSMYNYDFLNRNAASDRAGAPALSTADAAQRAQATLQHVVVTYTSSGGRRIYVNGEHTGDIDPGRPGTLSNWDDSFALVLGSEIDGSNVFQGTIRFVGIHSRSLTAEQVYRNFKAGVGERFYLLFGIGHLLPDNPPVYVLFEGSQFDSYAYLFAAPRVVSLDPAWRPGSLPIADMRIGVNGRLAGVGQAYATLSTTIADDHWVPGSGDELSRLGTVIPVENGPDFDQFFLTFGQLGALTYSEPETVPPAPGETVGDAAPDIGLRLFETINAALSAITTVPASEANVAAMYERVKQQLPATDEIESFSSAQQIGITQLAIEYCDALVEDPMSTIYFPSLNLAGPYTTALDTAAERHALIDPLVLHVANNALLSMPDINDMTGELDALVQRLTASCTGTCMADPVGRTKTIAKAACAAASGNAAMLLL